MTFQLLEFRTWRIQYDLEANHRIYEQITTGYPENCGCSNCLYFIENRNDFYSSELKDILAQLGIDYAKEAEAYNFSEENNPPWGGFYNFVGFIESGEHDFQIIDGNFKLTLDSMGGAVQKEFNDEPVARIEWFWPSGV